jgi:hypothetical protein
MGRDVIRVLLISETEHDCSNMRRLLENRGFRCWFGSSFDEAAALFDQHSFHLVVSTIRFHQYDGYLHKLSALPSTVFQCFQVEDGCWWLPVARSGQACLGAPALRAGEFLGAINQTVEEIRPRRALAARARV